jgi:2-keto-4-pentenoate hydratase/2-oxohepta-3-ene-1,7-dioic acid hydratase in catechol pathway
MRLARFDAGDGPRLGVLSGTGIIDLRDVDPTLPATIPDLLSAGEQVRSVLVAAARGNVPRVQLDSVRLLAPIPRPPKFLAVGANYADHIAEAGLEIPEYPTVFTKQSTCVTGPVDPIHHPRAAAQLDYEGELGFVIGRRCRHVPRQWATKVIAGFLVVNDVSVRDWQLRTSQWMIGKSFDTHGPTGPWVVTTDELGDGSGLDIRTFVNGEQRQASNTSQLIHDCAALVEQLSTAFTLEAGDIVTTGTPAGVGILMRPPRLLRPGDVVRVEIEGIGSIENTVIEEPESTRFINSIRTPEEVSP